MTNNKPGKYLIRRADDVAATIGLQPAASTQYQGVVNYPTTYGTILIRILVKQNTTDDLNIVHGYQSQYSITPIQRSTGDCAPTVSNILNNATISVNDPLTILNVLAKIASYNQPEVLSERYKVASILGFAGLVNGQYIQPSGVNLTKAYADAQDTYNTISSEAKNINQVGNGWQLSIDSFEGNFTTNYAPRALVAQTGYQQLVSDIVIYPGWQTSSFGNYYLAPNESFLFTFSAKPPIQGSSSLYPTGGITPDQAGFWSLTVYGPDQYLIDNVLNRYEVGDRTPSLQYEDGTKVYRADAPANESKPFQVLMQRADVAPPANWTVNWLPSPPGGGVLSFISVFVPISSKITC